MLLQCLGGLYRSSLFLRGDAGACLIILVVPGRLWSRAQRRTPAAIFVAVSAGCLLCVWLLGPRGYEGCLAQLEPLTRS